MRRKIGLLVPLLLLALATACSDGGERLVAGSGSPDEPAGDGATDPTGTPGGSPGGLVVGIEVGGGFVPVGWDFRSVPTAVVLEDGTTFSPGAHVLSFPGPAVLPVVRGGLAADEVEALVAAAAEAGLLGEAVDFGEPLVADAATTTITVVVDGVEHVTEVYALSGVPADSPGVGPEEADGLGVTPEQLEARRRVAGFVELATGTVGGAEGELYEPERYRVLPLPADPGDAGAVDGVEPDVREWPLPEVPLVEGTCTPVTGEAADVLRAALVEATEITRWRTEAGTFSLAVRPVLPHEPDCPAS